MRLIAGGALVTAVALAGTLVAGCGGTEPPPPPPPATVPVASGASIPDASCEESIGGARYSGTDEGARVVLGVISVPPEYRPEGAAPSGDETWMYSAELDLVLRADQPPIEIGVPKEWRNRVAISLGNTTIVQSLRFPSCPNNGLPWNAFTGTVYLKVRTACVPLTLRVGRQTATVRFGIGKRCGAG
ncbi:MAG: hypothetical protein H0U42_05675 [Thermoleophilaceae bacterium]|nr:hypothetical protein [Thermoleophilaceae bacterium]